MSFKVPKLPANHFSVPATIDDISTPGSAYAVVPFPGKLIAAYSVINGAITVADAILTVKKGGSAVTGGSMTVAYTGSAAGDVDSCEISSTAFLEGDVVEVATDGGSTGTVKSELALIFEV